MESFSHVCVNSAVLDFHAYLVVSLSLLSTSFHCHGMLFWWCGV